jgi:hypothetical protein
MKSKNEKVDTGFIVVKSSLSLRFIVFKLRKREYIGWIFISVI